MTGGIVVPLGGSPLGYVSPVQALSRQRSSPEASTSSRRDGLVCGSSAELQCSSQRLSQTVSFRQTTAAPSFTAASTSSSSSSSSSMGSASSHRTARATHWSSGHSHSEAHRARVIAHSSATLNQLGLSSPSLGGAGARSRSTCRHHMKWAEGVADEGWTLFTSEDLGLPEPEPVLEAEPALSGDKKASAAAGAGAGVDAEAERVPLGRGGGPAAQAEALREGKRLETSLPSASPRLSHPVQWDDSQWVEHEIDTDCSRGTDAGVPVYIMLPLDTVNMSNSICRPRAIRASLAALKSAGVEGVMMDVWWGIVEREGPGQYDWSAYKELVTLVKEAGLKAQVVMSFHQCGGNVGDHCLIPLPPWVHEAIDRDNDIVYTDKSGRRNREYLSLSVDDLPVLHGRTPIQAYSDFMRSFRDCFKDYLGSVITEIQVGMGPAGELRYPSYPEGNNLWRFPGIGEFQCYDKYMLAHLGAAAEAHGKPNWGYGGPHDAGCYKQWPQETGFFHENGNWRTAYGQFFLQWYSDMLLLHGHRVLSSAAAAFRESGILISGKVAGIHWHYGTQSHPAELTAGYYNTLGRDGYLPIAKMFGRHGAILNFTCIEMKDSEQPWYALCSPEGLLRQVAHAAKVAGIRVSGENALPRFDAEAFSQIVRKSRLQLDGVTAGDPMSSFTFLRMNEHLFRPENWRHFVLFVKHMREGRSVAHDLQCGSARDWVQAQLRATGSLSQAAAELLLQ